MESSSHFPDSFYRVSVKGLYVRDNKILLTLDTTHVRDGKSVALWDLPGGGMDFGETFRETLVREIREEMGLIVTTVAEKPMYLWTYKSTNRHSDWFYTLLLGFPFDVQDLHITPTPECQEARFFTKEEIRVLAVKGQCKEFCDIFNPEDF